MVGNVIIVNWDVTNHDFNWSYYVVAMVDYLVDVFMHDLLNTNIVEIKQVHYHVRGIVYNDSYPLINSSDSILGNCGNLEEINILKKLLVHCKGYWLVYERKKVSTYYEHSLYCRFGKTNLRKIGCILDHNLEL